MRPDFFKVFSRYLASRHLNLSTFLKKSYFPLVDENADFDEGFTKILREEERGLLSEEERQEKPSPFLFYCDEISNLK